MVAVIPEADALGLLSVGLVVLIALASVWRWRR